MKRRRILQLLSAAAAILWIRAVPSGTSLLEAAIPSRPSQEPPADNANLLLPLFPLNLVLFPETNLPLHIFEPRYREMIQDCLDNRWEFGILLDQEGSVSNIGCTASISEVLARFPDGRSNILVRGQRRFEISQLDEERSYLRGTVEFLGDDAGEPADDERRQRGIELYGRLSELLQLENQPFLTPSPIWTDMQLSYRMMAGIPAAADWKQELLELRSEPERLVRVIEFFEELIDYLESLPDEPSDSGQQTVKFRRLESFVPSKQNPA